jgi:DNA-binding transcriptional ArsR family regulator
MKYNLYVNQLKAIELGIKNINQAIVFDLLSNATTWATPVKIDDKFFYWVSRTKVCKELELLAFKPDTVYRHLKALDSLGLIDYRKDGYKDCVALTELGKSYHSETHNASMSEMNPNDENPYVGNESEEGRKQIRKDSEINPIDTSSSNTSTNIIQARKIFKAFHKRYKGIKREANTEFKAFIKEHKDWQDILPKLSSVILETPTDESFIPKLKNYLERREWESAKTVREPQWWDSRKGQAQKGKEYGLNVEDYSQYHQYLAAVTAKCKQAGELVYEQA